MKWLLIMLPCVALAGFWPSQDSVMQGGFDRGNQAIWAASERVDAVLGKGSWTNYAIAGITNDYFKQRTKIVASKAMTGAAIDSGKYTFQSTNWTPTNSITITRSNLIATIGVPTNWFDVTPAFNVATETNGFMFIPAAMSNVVWTHYVKDDYHDMMMSNLVSVEWSGFSTSSVEDAYYVYATTNVVAASTNESGYGILARTSIIIDFPGPGLYGSHLVKMTRTSADVRWTANTDATSTNFGGVSEIWMRVYPWDYADAINGSFFNNQIFDAVSTNTFKVISWNRPRYSEYGPAKRLGTTNDFSAPLWDTRLTNANMSAGWQLFDSQDADYHVLHKFNDPTATNGFKWFK